MGVHDIMVAKPHSRGIFRRLYTRVETHYTGEYWTWWQVDERGIPLTDAERAFRTEDAALNDAVKHFSVAHRRHKLRALWAAELMNIRGAEAEAYARQVVSADLDEPGDENVLHKVLGDFKRRSIAVPRDTVERRWTNCWPGGAISRN